VPEKPRREAGDGPEGGRGGTGREAAPGGRSEAVVSVATSPHPAAAPHHKVRGERRGGGGRRGWARGVDGPWRRGPRERGGRRRLRSAGEREGEGRRVRVRGRWCYIRDREERLGQWAVLGRW
jgi:hypothetical protein